MAESGEREAQDRRLRGLMVQSQAGHSVAYEELLGLVAGRAHAYFLRRIGDEDAAADFTQEVLISVHSSRRSFNPERSFLAWLGAIMHHRYVDSVRTYVGRLGTGRANVSMETIAAPPQVDHEGRAALLQEALERLPGKQRAAVELTQLGGFSTREAAGRLKMSEVGLRVTVYRAKQALFRILRDLEYEDD